MLPKQSYTGSCLQTFYAINGYVTNDCISERKLPRTVLGESSLWGWAWTLKIFSWRRMKTFLSVWILEFYWGREVSVKKLFSSTYFHLAFCNGPYLSYSHSFPAPKTFTSVIPMVFILTYSSRYTAFLGDGGGGRDVTGRGKESLYYFAICSLHNF